MNQQFLCMLENQIHWPVLSRQQVPNLFIHLGCSEIFPICNGRYFSPLYFTESCGISWVKILSIRLTIFPSMSGDFFVFGSNPTRLSSLCQVMKWHIETLDFSRWWSQAVDLWLQLLVQEIGSPICNKVLILFIWIRLGLGLELEVRVKNLRLLRLRFDLC